MAQPVGFDISDNHPLVLELTSLRTSVARFQDEAHATSIKLQRRSLDAARAHDRLSLLERENDVLRKEVAILRAHHPSRPHPDASPDAHPAASQVRQLSLSLRQLSDKLSHTEQALLTRTTELAHAQSEVKKAKYAADNANEVATRMLRREEAHTLRERELQLNLRTVNEQMKLSDLVMKDYADLVRRLEGRLAGPSRSKHDEASKAEEDTSQSIPGPSRAPLAGSLEEGKLGLQRLVSEFAEESERLQAEIIRLQNELATVEARDEAQKRSTEQHCLELARTQTELQKLRIDDNTAAKMVSRYMKFSQASTDVLQNALFSLKARHAATVDTLSSQMTFLTSQLRDAEAACERLRTALDELGGDYMKESYGRRREVALRIKLINREESLMESLRRWILHAQESLGKAQNVPSQDGITATMVNEARGILFYNDSPPDRPPSGSFARIISAQMAADSLIKELHAETARRLELERVLAVGQQDQPNINRNDYQESGTQYEASSLSVAIQASASPSDEAMVVSPLVIGLPNFGPVDNPNDIKEQSYTGHIPNGVNGLQGSSGGITTGEVVARENVDTRLEVEPSITAEMNAEDKHVEEHEFVKNDYLVDLSDHTERMSDTITVQGQGIPGQISMPEIVVVHAEEASQSVLLSSDGEPPAVHSEESRTIAVPPLDIPLAKLYTANGNTVDSPVQQLTLPTLDILPQPRHPLLAELARVNHRYDELQRAFHDCHFALDALKQSLATTSLNQRIPPDALRLALERLNDYIEDARVELEIQIADESLLARGYETLLSVPGALASPGPRSTGGGAQDLTPLRSEIEMQIEAFVSGAEPNVQKAQENLTHKLSDVQHDIAILKRAIHNQEDEASPVRSEEFTSSSLLFEPVPATAPVTGSRNGWVPWIRSPSLRPSSPAPTFGNVMTSPRLRHSPSLNMAGTRRPYDFSGSKDPLASLGFKVAMPVFVTSQAAVQPTARSRTVSTMHMIGLGARTASGSLTSLLSPQRIPKVETVESDEDGGVSDVE